MLISHIVYNAYRQFYCRRPAYFFVKNEVLLIIGNFTSHIILYDYDNL